MCISRLVKFIFACSLSLLLTFSCFVYPTFAQSTSFEYVEECFDNFDDPMFFPESETSGDAFSFFGLLPEISEEREVNWIDRIHNKPQYAVDFYDWLVENETLNGSLVSAHEETVVGDNKSSYQVHKIVSYSDTVYVDLKTGMTSKEALNLLYAKRDELFSDRVDDDFYTCAEWISEVYSAFDRDHPEAFWLSGGTIVSHKTKYTYGYDLANNIGLVKYVQNIYFRLHDDDFDIRSTAYCSHSNSNVTTVCSSACDLINNSIIEMNNAINKIM